jgi:hypothetical protein
MKNACWGQMHVFMRLFPNGVEPTEEVCTEVADKFDWSWAANAFLPPDLVWEFNRIQTEADTILQQEMALHEEELRSVENSARNELYRVQEKITALFWEEFEKATDPAWKKYQETISVAQRKLDIAQKEPLKRYNLCLALGFSRLWKEEHPSFC